MGGMLGMYHPGYVLVGRHAGYVPLWYTHPVYMPVYTPWYTHPLHPGTPPSSHHCCTVDQHPVVAQRGQLTKPWAQSGE